jgi:hypothetical protein
VTSKIRVNDNYVRGENKVGKKGREGSRDMSERTRETVHI